MPVPGIQALHLPFERDLVKKALEKHVHRSDFRKGINFNTRTAYGEPLPEKPSLSERESLQDGGILNSSRTKHITPAGVNSKAASQKRGEQLRVKPCLDAGTMDLVPPTPSGTAPTVRCRISKCINLAEPDDEAIMTFLRKNCEWRPMPLQVLGGAHYDIALPKSPRAGRFNEIEFTPRGKTPPAKSGSDLSKFSSRAFGRPAFMHTEEDWDFLRHVPPAANVKRPAREKHILVAKAFEHRAHLETLYSDVRALLGKRAEDTSDSTQSDDAPCAMSSVRFLRQAPNVTQLRWSHMLRPHDHHRWDGLAIARFLAQALADEPSQFRVLPESENSDASILQLLKEDRIAHGVEHKSLFKDDSSHGGRDSREVRFVNVIKSLKTVDAIVDSFRMSGLLRIDADRFVIMARTVDRTESLRLCGGIAAAGDRTHCHLALGSHSDTEYSRARRGKQLTTEWLLAAIAEASDDEELEDGDSIRLLAEVSHPSYAPAAFHNSESLTQPSVFLEGHADVSHSPIDPTRPREKLAESFDEDCWVSLNQSFANRRLPPSAPVSHSSASNSERTFARLSSAVSLNSQTSSGNHSVDSSSQRQSVGPVKTDMTIFHEFLQIVQRHVGHIDSGDQILTPVLLEALLQHVAQKWPGQKEGGVFPGFSKGLASHLLWERCGWDSPLGRRLIRKLRLVFSEHSTHGTLSQENFVNMVAAAGLTTKRDESAKYTRFGQAFSDIVGNNMHAAEFVDFIRLVERVAYWRSCSFEKSHFENSGVALITSEARHWPFIEHIVLQLAGSNETPSAPEWTAQSHYHRQASGAVHVKAEEVKEMKERPSSESLTFSEKSKSSVKKGSSDSKHKAPKKKTRKQKTLNSDSAVTEPVVENGSQ